MNLLKMMIAGFGGQGILFIGKIVAMTGLLEDRQVSWLPSYGPEMRGGTANCSICISDKPIGSPLFTDPNVLLVMNTPSYDKYIDTVVPGGTVVVDSSMTECVGRREDVQIHSIPATSIAADADMVGMANIILLGFAAALTRFPGVQSLEAALRASIPERKQYLLDQNLQALNLGMSFYTG